MAIGFSTKGEDNLVSPLMPTNGSKHISFGVKYDVNEQFAVSGGIRYTDLGDAISAPSGSAAATFSDNSAISVGLRLAYKF
jgi:long-chain fatty acid transport protein